MDINFDCPECKQNLDAPADMIDCIIDCPICSKEIRIPSTEDGGRIHPEAGIKEEQPSAQEESVAPPQPQEFSEDATKGVTTRIELPPDFTAPKRERKIFIKRRNG